MHLWTSTIAILCLVQFPISECKINNIVSGRHKIFLDVPTFMCHKYGIYFNEFFEELEKIRNLLGTSESVEIATFYNPEILGDRAPEKMGELSYVYQQRTDILEKVNTSFVGVGILNYTAWHPIFKQNQGLLKHYYNYSIENEQRMYPLLNENQTKKLATMRFEFSSNTFFSNTILSVQRFWPSATWGLFDYPKCNSLYEENLSVECDKEVMEDNDRLSWLWNLKIALFPYISLPTYFNRKMKQKHVSARLSEAKRIAEKHQPPLKIFPYLSLKYRDFRDHLMSYVELFVVFEEILETGIADGVIIWGSKDDLNSEEKCRSHEYYFGNELIPVIRNFLNIV